MSNYVFEGDGLYPLTFEPNTDVTTFIPGDIPAGAVVVVGVGSGSGWIPLVGGTLQAFTPVALSHGHDVKLSILVNGSNDTVFSVETRKEGVPSYYNVLNQIAENTAAPIKVDAPLDGGYWRTQGQWVLDPIQTDAPNDTLPYARVSNTDSWAETITRTEFESDKAAQEDRLLVLEDTIPASIMYGNDNAQTTTTDALSTFTTLNFDQMIHPPGFEGEWVFSAVDCTFTFIGTRPRGFKILISGAIDSSSTSNTDYIFVRVVDGNGGIFTGSTKRYPCGSAVGQITSAVGFTTLAFGLISPGENFQLQAAKDFAGDLTLTDVILNVEPI